MSSSAAAGGALPAAVRATLEGFKRLGIDPRRVLDRCGADVMTSANGVQQSQGYALWAAAVAATGESGLGVRLAEHNQTEDFGLYGSLIATSSSLGEALLHGMRFLRWYARTVQVFLRTDGTCACVGIEVGRPPFLHPEVIEFMVASGVLGARTLTGHEFVPLEVCFSHDAPRDLSHHQRVFRAPLRFGAAQTACYFDSTSLLLPVRGRDAALQASLVAEAERRLMTGWEAQDFLRLVREAITRELVHSDASCRRVAARLSMHPKALTRRLEAQGVHYRRLLEQVRYELAEQLLRRPEAPIHQVALLLGYSDRSAFNRAFKRWSGCSPFEYRKRLGVTATE